MAKLYAKVDSDIRAGLGCRAKDRIKVTVFYNFDGRNEQDGELVVEAEHDGSEVRMTTYARARGGDGNVMEEPLSEIVFRPRKIDVIRLSEGRD
jgi:hypothetical protein